MTTPSTPELSDEQLKIVERVQKILALADRNPHQAEAAVAAGKAQELLEAYSLDMVTIERASGATGRREEQHVAGGMYQHVAGGMYQHGAGGDGRGDRWMSKFTTRIDATGPSGNVFVVLATAISLMRQIKVSPTEISILQGQVNSAKSYAEALDYVRQWFPVDTGDRN